MHTVSVNVTYTDTMVKGYIWNRVLLHGQSMYFQCYCDVYTLIQARHLYWSMDWASIRRWEIGRLLFFKILELCMLWTRMCCKVLLPRPGLC